MLFYIKNIVVFCNIDIKLPGNVKHESLKLTVKNIIGHDKEIPV